MDDTFRLDLEDYDKPYIEEVLDSFVGDAPRYGRKVLAIRMSEVMSERLGIAAASSGGFFKGVPVVICDTGFEGTIEVILGPLN